MSSQPLRYRVARFINEKILRNTKESSVDLIQNVTAGRVYLFHALKAKFNRPLKLQPMNSGVPFPMPSRFSYQDWTYNANAVYMTIKKLLLNLAPANTAQKDAIEMAKDHNRSLIYVMKLLYTFRKKQVEEIQKVIEIFGKEEENVKYTYARQVMFADSIINGEYPFMLRKLHHDHFDLQESRPVHTAYLAELNQALNGEEFNQQNLSTAGITKTDLKSAIEKGNAYCILYEDLELHADGKALWHKPTIYMDNQEIGEEYVMQVPFPVFVKVNNAFLCVAIGFRFTLEGGEERVKFFSPFFSRQPQKLWRLAQNHFTSVVFNDFNVRVHLAGWHLSTNQFNVPIYNFLTSKGRPLSQQNNIDMFIKYGYSTFNRGLQDINTISFATLIHPVYEYSLVNRIFNFSQESALSIMASFSNRINFSKWSPMDLLKANGITSQDVNTNFDVIGLQLRLYQIISKHIKNLWSIYEMESQANSLMVAINKEIDNMVVGGGRRRQYISQEDVLPLITNLVYSWVGYHSHTFGSILMNSYWKFRPTMLKTQVPFQEKEWDKIEVGEEYPHTKVMMEGAKLEADTTQRDSDYILLGVLKRQAVRVNEEIEFKNVADIEKHYALRTALNQVIGELKEFQKQVIEVNKKREADKRLHITWMYPSDMQSSLNT